MLTGAAGSEPNRAHTRELVTSESSHFPVFIPTSAIHAFIYQAASLMNLELFKNFDQDLIEKLGPEEVGKWKWRKLNQDEKYQVAHDAISDVSRYRQRLEATNFDKFLLALGKTVGGNERQLKLIELQLMVATKAISPANCVASQIRCIFEKRSVLGHATESLIAAFWRTYSDAETIAFARLKSPSDVPKLKHLPAYLSAFWDLCKDVGWLDQKLTILSQLKGIVRRQLATLFNEERYSRNLDWQAETFVTPALLTWEDLSPEDWKLVVRSVLAASWNPTFIRAWYPELLLLQSLLDKIVQKSVCYLCAEYHFNCSCENSNYALGFRVESNTFEPLENNLFLKVYQIPVPESLEDPRNWGYLASKVASAIESIENDL